MLRRRQLQAACAAAPAGASAYEWLFQLAGFTVYPPQCVSSHTVHGAPTLRIASPWATGPPAFGACEKSVLAPLVNFFDWRQSQKSYSSPQELFPDWLTLRNKASTTSREKTTATNYQFFKSPVGKKIPSQIKTIASQKKSASLPLPPLGPPFPSEPEGGSLRAAPLRTGS